VFYFEFRMFEVLFGCIMCHGVLNTATGEVKKKK